MEFPLLSVSVDRGLERGERSLSAPVEVGADLAQATRIEPVDAARFVTALGHEPGFFQHTQVLRDRPRTTLQELEDPLRRLVEQRAFE